MGEVALLDFVLWRKSIQTDQQDPGMRSIAGEHQVAEVLVLCDQDDVAGMCEDKHMLVISTQVRVTDVLDGMVCRDQRPDDVPVHAFISKEVHS